MQKRFLKRLFFSQKGYTLVEVGITLVMSGIMLAGISVIVSGSHTYIIKERKKVNLQKDFSLIDQVMSKNVREGIHGQQEIYASYSDYTGSGTPQSSGTCLKLYFPSGDSMVIYKENSDFKIQKADLSIHNLVPTVLDTILFTEGTKSIKTALTVKEDGKTVTGNFMHTFRNISTSANTDTLRPTGNGAFTQIDDTDCSTNWECVDDVIADEGATRVRERDGTWSTDSYATSDGSSAAQIDSVVVYFRGRKDDDNAQGRTALYTYSTTYYGVIVDLDGVENYVNNSTTYTTNPNTSAAWTSAEIDAMQIGVRLYYARCTQVWAIVYYEP